MPDALSLPRSELPEEIKKAIQHLARICMVAPGFDDAVIANRNIRNGVDALIAAILSRLGEAEARREEARANQRAAEDQNDALHDKLRALAPHGSCACSYDHPDDTCMHHSPTLSAALARVERLESALQQMLKPFPCVSGPPEDALEDWMAAVSRFRAAARSALSEAPPQGEP